MTSCAICCSATTRRCTRCWGVFYCSKECQRKDWKTHKSSCKKKPKPEVKTPVPKRKSDDSSQKAKTETRLKPKLDKTVPLEDQVEKSLVEVKASTFGGKRGLFLTQNVKKGQVIMEERPWVVSFMDKSSMDKMDPWWSLTWSYFKHHFNPKLVPEEFQHLSEGVKKHGLYKLRQNYDNGHIFTQWHAGDDHYLMSLTTCARLGNLALKFAEIKEIHEILNTNAIPVCPGIIDGRPKRRGVYFVLSRVNHSCQPNCILVPLENNALSLVATEDLKVETELTMGYRVLATIDKTLISLDALAVDLRRKWLKDVFNFHCKCAACEAGFVRTLPYNLNLSKLIFE